MKKFLILLIFCSIGVMSHAQFFKKLKDKVNKTVDKTIDKATGTNNPKTETEKKEDAASIHYDVAFL